MSKQKIEIEVDAPEGYELTGEYRQVQKGEFFLNCVNIACSRHGPASLGAYLILRKKWEAPKWLHRGVWLYKDCGSWWVSNHDPECFAFHGTYTFQLESLVNVLDYRDFEKPPVNKIFIPKEDD